MKSRRSKTNAVEALLTVTCDGESEAVITITGEKSDILQRLSEPFRSQLPCDRSYSACVRVSLDQVLAEPDAVAELKLLVEKAVSASCTVRPGQVILDRIPENVGIIDESKGNEPLTKNRLVEHFSPPQPVSSADALLQTLTGDLQAFITAERLAALEYTLLAAQKNPPTDKRAFAIDVNHLLDVFRVRIQGDDGKLYRLRVVPGKSGKGFLLLSGGGEANRGRGFNEGTIRLVPDPNKPQQAVAKPSLK